MTTPDTDVLLTRAQSWLAEDPDVQTRDELVRVIAAVEAGDAAARADLADRFRGTLEFGTAGLRGALGAGPNRMNRVVVLRAAAGLAAYLLDTGTAPGTPVVIGYDARHNSDVFAHDTAEVMAGAGLKPLLLPRPLPTPLLAFAIRELGCAAGVMVTASHNPPQDNGYKVYLGDGSQIVPPADTEIAARIAAVGNLESVARVPLGTTGGRVLDDGIVDAYLDTVAAIAADGPRDLTIVYTPLHGVGGGALPSVLETAGFAAPQVVAEQEAPDPDFPTVAFPNPEEPGAIDRAVALAEQTGADIVIANDPDADRCAAAVPGPDGWRMLRGDEVGALLADHLLRAGRTGVYATSIVSSSLLGTMAKAHGQRYAETLTGFKWIGRLPELVFGYEEALGYCVDPTHVSDKDGVSAALLLCEIAAEAKAAGRSLLDLLDDIAVTHGLHATDQLSVRVTDLGEIATAMARLREAPPATLGGSAVTAADDLAAGSAQLPPTDGLRYRTADGSRVVVRPSGTEPKLKCYLEVVVPVVDGDVASARAEAATRLTALRADIAAAAGI
ncbi:MULTISPECIES: phospho-sugar mutase [unclassified Nocardioides]|uniref:phospho-sugar mutase n=1 Tax=unclassified Nocardioides TaxID=2615069 RepID=UPI001167E5E2|nr:MULTISPECIES: phospho-sugar mutase [unclassified Nocardioides]TQK72432.1 phosphomannomutase [Nocardioides sp. SLBN-35]WGY03363.1 phospho-sugar mutase [Nocardioides sp. QY071]